MFDHFQFALIYGWNIPGSNAILLFRVSELASITSHIHNWVVLVFILFLFFCLGSFFSFFLELFLHWSPVAYWAPLTWRVHLSVSSLFAFSYCPWSFQGKNTEVACHSLLHWTTFCSALSTMTHASSVAQHDMAHSFIELDKVVVHVISLISFL